MTNEQAAVVDRVRSIVSSQANVPLSAVTESSSLLGAALDLDSLDLVEIQMELEDHFMIPIADEELVNVKTVGDLVKLVLSKDFS